MNAQQKALIFKDVRTITANKRLLSTMLIVPIVLTIFIPSVFLFAAVLAPDASNDLQSLLELLPEMPKGDPVNLMASLLLNKIMPVFFMMIPVMASSVMAASSFVGEKEKRTLETLLFSPLTIRQLFFAKIAAAFLVGMLVSVVSFAAMMAVIEAEAMFLTGALIVPEIGWLIVMCLVSPAIAVAAIAFTVRGSAKARTVEESQQSAGFLVLPLALILVGQFSGVLLLNTWILLAIGAVIALIAIPLMRGAASSFTYEKLLK